MFKPTVRVTLIDPQRTPESDPGLSPPGGASETGCCEVYYVDADRVARVRAAMLTDDHAQRVADTFKVLGHPTRIKMIRALAREELCVCDLAQVLGRSISAVSHQLRPMRAGGLVVSRTEGKLVYYRLRDTFGADCIEEAVRHVAHGQAEP